MLIKTDFPSKYAYHATSFERKDKDHGKRETCSLLAATNASDLPAPVLAQASSLKEVSQTGTAREDGWSDVMDKWMDGQTDGRWTEIHTKKHLFCFSGETWPAQSSLYNYWAPRAGPGRQSK